jgi:hypothetical protein
MREEQSGRSWDIANYPLQRRDRICGVAGVKSARKVGEATLRAGVAVKSALLVRFVRDCVEARSVACRDPCSSRQGVNDEDPTLTDGVAPPSSPKEFRSIQTMAPYLASVEPL